MPILRAAIQVRALIRGEVRRKDAEGHDDEKEGIYKGSILEGGAVPIAASMRIFGCLVRV